MLGVLFVHQYQRVANPTTGTTAQATFTVVTTNTALIVSVVITPYDLLESVIWLRRQRGCGTNVCVRLGYHWTDSEIVSR